MRAVHGIPFLKLLPPFLLGIIIYKYWSAYSINFWIVAFLLTLLAAVSFQSLKFEQRIKFAWFNGTILQIGFVALGYTISFAYNVENKPSWYKHHISESSVLKARITTPIKPTERTFKTTADIISVINHQKIIKTSGSAILYFQKSSAAPNLSIGEELFFVNKLNPIISKGNPGEFDYAAFCRNKGIYDQAFLTTNEWKISQNNLDKFRSPFTSWHQKIKNILAEHIPDSNSFGIAQALITGDRNDIDKETYNEYTKTGLVHLLAISGLHMGIFYLGAQWFLGLFRFFKKRKRALIFISIILMWLFALVTTFPPSVQRASLMFTFLGIGQMFNRNIPSYQFLFLSAFIILLFQPFLLFEVGFQLSYAAVLGILLFFRPLRNLVYPKNLILSKIWDIMCVTLAAQIFTFPLAIYYFHQLPTMFLFTNIVAIPAVTLIIYGEVLLIIFSFVPAFAQLLGEIISFIIESLNSFIHFTSTLSFVNVTDIKISTLQAFLLFVLMLSLTAWLLAKRKLFAPISLSLFLLFLIISINNKARQLQQKKIIVYNTDQPYIEIIKGQSVFSSDIVSVEKYQSFLDYTLKPSHLKYGIKSTKSLFPKWKQGRYFDILNFENKRILRVKNASKLKFREKVEVDYLIISDKWIKQSSNLLAHIKTNEIIIDGNIPLWKIVELKSELQGVNLPIHYIGTEGAKIISL